MRGLLSKFKILKKNSEKRAAVITAKWRVILYSLPILALFEPDTTHAAGALKTLGKTAVSFGGDAIKGVFGAGVEAGAALIAWLIVITALSDIIADLFSGIFLFLINFLIGVSQYNSFLGSSVVTIGWTVTRDLANMFLVVALLVIAFATILNINSYQASNLLKEFFFAAILVNFSKLICGVLIDASQVVMMTFVSGYSETAAGNFVKMFQVGEWLQLALATKDAQMEGSGPAFNTATADAATKALATGADAIGALAANFFSGIGANIFTAIIAFIGILAVISLDIILVVRIVTLWFLIVASPLAFVAKVLPVTKSFSSKWWHAFNQQLVSGPVVAFIVWISLASIAVSDDAFSLMKEAKNADKIFAETQAAAPAAVAGTKISQWENLALYFVPIVIFFLGAKWAVSISGDTAKSIAGFANKRLSGFARSGLSALRNQAVGKGRFSIVTAGKKGFAGEQAPITSFLGKVGSGVNQMSGGKFNKIEKAASKVFGSEARGSRQAGYKNMKNAVSHLGFGELGEKRTKAAEAEELGQHFDQTGKQYFDEYMKKSEAATDPAEQAKYRAQALSYKSTYDTKASEARKKASEYQKDIFKAEGKTDPQVLLNHVEEQMKNGKMSTLEFDTANEMINDYYEKEEKKQINKKKAEMGSAWDPAKHENEIKGRVGSEQEAAKDRLKQVVDNYKPADERTRDTTLKQARDVNAKHLELSTPRGAVKQAATEYESSIEGARTRGTGVVSPDLQTESDAKLTSALNDAFKKQNDRAVALPDRADQEKKNDALLMSAVNKMPLAQQTAFLDARSKDDNADVALRETAGRMYKKMQDIAADPRGELQTILSRHSAREKKSEDDRMFSPSDIGLKKDRKSGDYSLEGEEAAKFAAALDTDLPAVVGRLKTETLVPQVRNIIADKVTDAGSLMKVLESIDKSATDAQDPGGIERRSRGNAIAKTVAMRKPELRLQAQMIADQYWASKSDETNTTIQPPTNTKQGRRQAARGNNRKHGGGGGKNKP